MINTLDGAPSKRTRMYRRLSGKSRHADFPLEKPTRRFFAGKADMSIFHWKSRHVDFSLKKRTVDFSWKRAHFGPEFKLLLFELRSTDTEKSSGSLCTLFICIFWYRFFNYTFIKLIFFNREKILGSDLSASATCIHRKASEMVSVQGCDCCRYCLG